jgi:hypothetical protein
MNELSRCLGAWGILGGAAASSTVQTDGGGANRRPGGRQRCCLAVGQGTAGRVGLSSSSGRRTCAAGRATQQGQAGPTAAVCGLA